MRRTVRRMSRRRDDAGYTLTEMLVVIGIICLIAAVLTPNLMGQLGRARVKAADLELQTVAAAVETFRSDVGRYPTEAEGLAALIKEPSGVEGWSGPYLRDRKSLQDPWNHPLVYKVVGDGERFYVESYGSDGKPGGADQAKDLRSPAS